MCGEINKCVDAAVTISLYKRMPPAFRLLKITILTLITAPYVITSGWTPFLTMSLYVSQVLISNEGTTDTVQKYLSKTIKKTDKAKEATRREKSVEM